MNNGRLWCVVNPTVGLPLFLGAVALTSLTVHSAILNNTTWMKDFYNGSYKGKTAYNAKDAVAPVALAASSADPSFVINVAPAAGTAANGAASFVVTVTPKPVTTASASKL
jgi:light-harvesting protein B-800-850 alpha chain